MADDRQNSEDLTVGAGATETTTGSINAQKSSAVAVFINGDANSGDLDISLVTNARSANTATETITPNFDLSVANRDATGDLVVIFPVYGIVTEAQVEVTNNGASSTTITVEWEGN